MVIVIVIVIVVESICHEPERSRRPDGLRSAFRISQSLHDIVFCSFGVEVKLRDVLQALMISNAEHTVSFQKFMFVFAA